MLTAAVAADPANGVLVVTLRGLFTVQSAPTVRDALLKCLAEAPDAVLVDVSEMRVETRSRLATFPAAQRAAGAGAAPIILYGAGPDLRVLMRGRTLGGVCVCETLGDALAAVAARDPATAPRRRLTLPATPSAPAQARAEVAAACQDWRVGHLTEPATQVISELVSNAVQHAGPGDVHLTAALRGRYLHLSVRDHSARQPVAAGNGRPATRADRGRGLFLVDVYATAWGSTPTSEGKTVWATLRATPTSP
ncbi:ATP-binding protein [Actinomycetes bacterium KLBMP 9797]